MADGSTTMLQLALETAGLQLGLGTVVRYVLGKSRAPFNKEEIGAS
jgi:hypothetical protein